MRGNHSDPEKENLTTNGKSFWPCIHRRLPTFGNRPNPKWKTSMNTWPLRSLRPIFLLTVLLSCGKVSAAVSGFQSVSQIDSSQPSPAGGNGDSWSPAISPDGRFVLFASTANNLMLNSSANPIAALNYRREN